MDKKVLIADQINEKGIDELTDIAEVVSNFTISKEELLDVIKDFDAIIVRSRTKVTCEVIEASNKLKIIARAGVGVDNVDVQAATERGVMVINAPESTSITVAEHTMGLILALSRKIAIADSSVKQGKWEKSKFMGHRAQRQNTRCNWDGKNWKSGCNPFKSVWNGYTRI